MPAPDARADADADPNDGDDSTPDRSHSSYWPRVRELAAEADAERRAFEPPATPPDEERALSYLTEGAGRVVAVYVEARTEERGVAFSETEHALLHRSLNDWLDLYARCHGVELDADFTVREAAELLIETHSIRDTARLLTRVPPR